jgi:thioesterase domain-containing protein
MLKIAVLDLWREQDRAQFHTVRREMSERGVHVVDVYEPTAPFRTSRQWVDAMESKLLSSFGPHEEIHLLGFCAGGRVAMTLSERLEQSGRRASFIGLIETWQRSPLVELDRALYSRFSVGVKLMVRQQLQWLTSAPGANWRQLVKSYRTNASSILRRNQILRDAQQRKDSFEEWKLMHFTHASAISVITTPAHLFNSSDSMDEFLGDPSLGLAPYLRGGFEVHRLNGEHHSCTQDPHRGELVDLVIATMESLSSPR